MPAFPLAQRPGMLAFLWLASCGTAFAAQSVAMTPVKFDALLAVELAKSYLQAHFREFPQRFPGELRWAEPIVVAARIAGDRELVYVGFRPVRGNIGAEMVLEQCQPLVPNHYGAAIDVEKAAAAFKSTHGTPEAGPYSACAKTVD